MKTKILLFIIFLLAFLVRFYNLGIVPDGLSQDETSIGYNAYSILQTGKDEYGNSYPISFKAFGEYKLPGYIYLAVPSIAYFGTTPFGVRFPSAIFGFLTVVVFYFFVRKLTNNNRLAIIATFFLALNPWHIHFSRAAFEVVPALFFILSGAYLLLQFIGTKKYIYLIFSGCFFVFSIYTYNICRVLTPFIVIILFYFYRKDISFRHISFWLSNVPSLLLLIPFLLNVFTTGGFAATKGTLLYSSAPIQAQLLELRSMVVMHSPLFAKIFFNKLILTLFEYIRHIIDYLSVSFFFISGSDHGNHGIGNFGMFYVFEFITISAGVIAYIKRQQRWMTILALWFVAGILVAAFTREAPHGARGFFLIPPLVVFSAYGFYKIISAILKLSFPIRQVITALIIIFIAFNILYYFSSYYFRFPVLYGKSWRSEDSKLIDYLRVNQKDYDKIIFDQSTAFIYTSLLYYLPYSPNDFQKEVLRGPDDSEGFSKVHSFGKYSMQSLDWSKISGEHKILVVTIPQNVPAEIGILKAFYYPSRPVVIAKGQEILQFPAKDVAYVLVKIQ
jgi:4-amino-4-deoxy-L-arabinose transferase-like glycosyltransferase